MIDLESFDGVTEGEEGAGESAKARANFLDGGGGFFGQGVGNDGGEGGFGEKVLPKLAEGAKTAGV